MATIPDSGRTQRKLSVPIDAAPQRILLGHGNARIIAGMASARTSVTALPGLSITANHVLRPFTSRKLNWSRVTPFLRQNPSNAASGAPSGGPLASSRTASVCCGISRAISARRRGVDQTVISPGLTPALSISARNSRSRSARAPFCIRAGISSQRSSSRKLVMPTTPEISAPIRLSSVPYAFRTTRAPDRARGPYSWRVPAH